MERPHLKRQLAALVFAIWFLVGLAACAGYTSSGNHGNPGGSVAPMITAQPTNQTVTAGQTATFTVTATGTAPLSYQWQSAPSGSANYTNIAGATSSSYSLMNTTTAQSGMTFRVVVSNSVNPAATSNAATLTSTQRRLLRLLPRSRRIRRLPQVGRRPSRWWRRERHR